MPFRIEPNDGPDELFVRPLAVAAIDGQIAQDADNGQACPLVLVAMGVRNEQDRLEENYYALGGQDVLLLLGALRAAGSKVFGTGFMHSADIVATMSRDELEHWLASGANPQKLGD